jgi:hypothetical protein
VDNGFLPQRVTVLTDAEAEVEFDPALIGGVNVLSVPALVDGDAFPDGLYADIGTVSVTERTLKMIPYYAWNNRGANYMQVWLRRA